MPKGRPAGSVSVTDAERIQLETWSRRPKTAQALALRSRVVLLAASGESNAAIARQLSARPHTVGKWRKRFIERGLDGLLDEPRPGTPRKLSDQQIERVLTRTLESQPEAATHWSTIPSLAFVRELQTQHTRESFALILGEGRVLDRTGGLSGT